MWRHVLFFFFFFFPGIPWWYSCWASLYHATLWSHRKIMIVFNLITFPNFRNISYRVYLSITFTGCFNIWRLATLKKLAFFFFLLYRPWTFPEGPTCQELQSSGFTSLTTKTYSPVVVYGSLPQNWCGSILIVLLSFPDPPYNIIELRKEITSWKDTTNGPK